eukprot:6181199-Pleurochrysis_carterae.AAC.1
MRALKLAFVKDHDALHFLKACEHLRAGHANGGIIRYEAERRCGPRLLSLPLPASHFPPASPYQSVALSLSVARTSAVIRRPLSECLA